MSDDDAPSFTAREGDVLVVSFPNAKLSPAGTYSSVEVGGAVYTRKMKDGDDVDVEYAKIYAYLRRRCEADGRTRVLEFMEDLKGLRGR